MPSPKNILIYRISTSSRNQISDGFDKLRLLARWLSFDWDSIHIVADNCSEDLINQLKNISHQPKLHITSLGNTKSFLFCLTLANDYAPNDLICLQEDDYYIEGIDFLELRNLLQAAHFVSLYSHPDKQPWLKTTNLELSDLCVNQFSEKTRLYFSVGSEKLWRTTSSTTLSFITKKQRLILFAILFKYLAGKDSIPRDEIIWRLLTRQYYKNYQVLLFRKLCKNWLIFFGSFFLPKYILLVPVETISVHLDRNVMSVAEINELIDE